jgi:hypothetical protein
VETRDFDLAPVGLPFRPKGRIHLPEQPSWEKMPDPSSSLLSSSDSSTKLKAELLDAQVALDQGDLRTARRRLKTLSDPNIPIPAELRDEVTKLSRQVDADPYVRYLAAGCLLFFLIVALRYVV